MPPALARFALTTISLAVAACASRSPADPAVAPERDPRCLEEGDYAVALTLADTTCSADAALHDDGYFYCTVPTVDARRPTAARRREDLDCTAAPALASVWTITTSCDDDGVTGEYRVDWDASTSLERLDVLASSDADLQQLLIGGDADDRYHDDVGLSGAFGMSNTTSFAGRLVVHLRGLDGTACDETYDVHAAL